MVEKGVEEVVKAAAGGMVEEEGGFRGILYGGLMVRGEG